MEHGVSTPFPLSLFSGQTSPGSYVQAQRMDCSMALHLTWLTSLASTTQLSEACPGAGREAVLIGVLAGTPSPNSRNRSAPLEGTGRAECAIAHTELEKGWAEARQGGYRQGLPTPLPGP